jgi:hypothetical protein
MLQLVSRFCLAIAIAWSAILAAPLEAQIVLRQPVVGGTGVRTAVSVPDGGSAFLGGVSRSRESRARYGLPPAWGSALGYESSHSAMDVRVRVHDFEAMDAWLLAQPRRDRVSLRPPLMPQPPPGTDIGSGIPRAALGGFAPRAGDPAHPRVGSGATSVATRQSADARLLALGDDARARSDRLGALRYYQSARRLGSLVAEQRIQALLAE